MNWRNAYNDIRPKDNQDVLICVSGIYHLAIYKADQKGFELYEYDDFIPVKNSVYWTEISVPNKNLAEQKKSA
jgi:hypothetical protein